MSTPANNQKSPSDFLKLVLGRPVIVKLNSGVVYKGNYMVIYYLIFIISFKGILACLDGYMNIAMEQTEEYVNGQLKSKYGDAFIRGNNGVCRISLITYMFPLVLYISTQSTKKTRK